jgi:hypothetical protein
VKNITQEWSKIRVCHDHIVAGKDYFVSTYHCMVEKMGMSSDFVSDAPSQLWSCNHTIAKKYDTVIRLWIRYTPPQDHNCGPKSQKSVLLFGCYYKVLRVKPGTHIYIYIYIYICYQRYSSELRSGEKASRFSCPHRNGSSHTTN